MQLARDRFQLPVGPDFQPFGFNGMEMVDLTIVSWNRVTSWLQGLERLRRAA
jgi:hypothetical protein